MKSFDRRPWTRWGTRFGSVILAVSSTVRTTTPASASRAISSRTMDSGPKKYTER
jgi:hypothetical protein